MTGVIDVIPRQRPLKAMRVLLGTTTRADITAFCPRANVGHVGKEGIDIRWVAVPHNGDLWDRIDNDGDWIVEKSPGHFFTYADTDFHREYVIA